MEGVPSPARLRARAAILRALRDTLHDWGYLEVDVPVAVRSPAMEPHLHAFPFGPDRWLHTSPEFALKRVLAAGLPRVYSIVPCFRAEELGPLHAAEFTMLEWYRAGASHHEVLEELEELVARAGRAVGRSVPAFRRTSWAEAFRIHAGREAPPEPEQAMLLWVQEVEPALRPPTAVLEYPAWQAAFAEIRGGCAQRFELYWEGVELANAFTELLDPVELVERWERANAERLAEGRPPHPVDPRLVEAVGRHPRAGGIAVGVDRLVMVLLGEHSIHPLRVEG